MNKIFKTAAQLVQMIFFLFALSVLWGAESWFTRREVS